MFPAYKALASRMGNSGELARDLRGAMMTAVCRRAWVIKGQETTSKRGDHEEFESARAAGAMRGRARLR